MNNDDSDNNNPFAPRKPAESGKSGATESRDRVVEDLSPEDESDEYRFDYSEDDYDYDPDEFIDEQEDSDSGPLSQPSQRLSTAASRSAHGEGDDESAATQLPSMSARNPGSAFYNDGDLDHEQDDSYYEDDDDSEEWDEGEDGEDEAGFFGFWPVGMLAIAGIAVILLAVGGFGVMHERSTMQEQIRALQSELALAVDPQQLAVERGSQRKVMERNRTLEASVQELQLDNRQLSDTVRGLEQQLEVQQAAASKVPDSKPAAAEPPPAEKAPTKTPASTSGNWFVNFGSYREKSHAERWAGRLAPAAGKVVVAAAPGGDLFRVRVVALPNKKTADQVAAELQSKYGLSELWVGEQ